MFNKHGINVESFEKSLMKKKLCDLLSVFPIYKAYAEEIDDPIEDSNDGSTVSFDELITKARKEEKAKQYNTIKKLKESNSTLTNQLNDALLNNAALEKQLKELDKGEVANLTSQINTLNSEKQALEAQLKGFDGFVKREDVESQIRAELENEFNVRTHKIEILAQHKEDLLVPELVTGNTVEELDASLTAALERSNQIRQQLGAVNNSNNSKTHQQDQPRIPVTNPSVSGIQDSEYSLEYLASLDPSSEEYKEVRKKLGLK